MKNLKVKISKIFKERNFLTSLSVLAFGSAASQFLSFLASPLISRIYTDYEMGHYTLILSVISLFSFSLAGRYDLSLVTENEPAYVSLLIRLCKKVILFTTPIYTVLSVLFIAKSESASFPLWLSLIFIFALLSLNGINLIYQSLLNREKEYSKIASANIINVFSKNVLTIILGFFHLGAIGLVMSLICGLIFQLIWLRGTVHKMRYFSDNVDYGDLRLVARKHKQQPCFSLPASFAMQFSQQAPNIFMNLLFGKAVLGQFGFSQRILALPISIIAMNVSKVYFQEASREYDKSGTYYKSFKKVSIFLTVLAIPIGTIIFFLGPPIIKWFLGEQWTQASIMAKYMSPLYTAQFIVSPLAVGALISKKQKVELQMQLLFVAGTFLIYFIAKIMQITLLPYLYGLVGINCINFGLYFLRLRNMAKNDLSGS